MKNAKRSVIITAILAIIMCASLIVGGTLALFTSNSKVNIVVSSANVDVAADVTVAEKWHKDGGATVTGSLYDTGSVEVANGSKQVDVTLNNFVPTDGVKLNVALTNNSTVKVKYRVILSANRESGTELLDALKISMNGKEFRGYTLASEFLALEAETSPVEPVSVTIEFPEDATEGMNMSCNLTIKVEAQQGNAVALNTFEVADGHTVIAEKVGGVNWYSEVDNATLLEEVKNGAKLSGNLTLTEDVDLDKTLVVADNTSVEITSDKTVSNSNDLWDKSTGMWSLVSARGENSVTTINGGEWNAKENDCYAVDVQNGAKVVINDGTFIGNIHSVYVTDGIAEIKGGFFSVQQKYPDASKANEFVLNCLDANHANGTANIIVTGGTFVNFNPADCYAEGEHTNFVADGYHVEVAVQENGDVWYTVENGAVTTVSAVEGQNTAEVLSEVFKTAESGKSLYVALKDDVTIDTLSINGTTNDGVKDIVIDANGHTIKTEKADGSRCVRVESSTVERTYTLMNAKIVCTATTASINAGEQRGQQIYEVENATINLVNCTVEMTANNFSYPVKVIGGKNLTVNIKGCTLTGANCIEVVDSSDCTFNIADCVLNSNYPDNTRYVGEGIQDKGSRNNTYNVKNCTFNGSNAAPWELGAGSVVNDLGGNVYNMTISEKA